MRKKRQKGVVRIAPKDFKLSDTLPLIHGETEIPMKGLTILRFHKFTIPLSELKIIQKEGKGKMSYESNKDAGFGKKHSYAPLCQDWNKELEWSIKNMMIDRAFYFARLLKNRNCPIFQKNQNFLDRFESD